MKFPLLAAALAAPVALHAALAEEAVSGLTGHRAVYEIEQAPGRASGEVLGARGRYVFDLEDICEGYTLNERLVMTLARRSDSVLTDYWQSGFETADGALYRFSSETSFNGVSAQRADGVFSVGEDGSELDFEKAEDVAFDERVLAPVAHLRAVLAAARAGEERHAGLVFDGDVERPVFFAVTRIVEGGADPAGDAAPALDGLRRWKLDSVYYPAAGAAQQPGETPEFAFTGVLYENGVMGDMVLDYVDFALSATLSTLELRDFGC